jgi:hypothetical protein
MAFGEREVKQVSTGDPVRPDGRTARRRTRDGRVYAGRLLFVILVVAYLGNWALAGLGGGGDSVLRVGNRPPAPTDDGVPPPPDGLPGIAGVAMAPEPSPLSLLLIALPIAGALLGRRHRQGSAAK